MSITSQQIQSIIAETTDISAMVYAEIEKQHKTDQVLLDLPLTNILLNADKTMLDEKLGYVRGNTRGILQDYCVHIKAKALRGVNSTLQDLSEACELSVNGFAVDMGDGPVNPSKLGRWIMLQALRQQTVYAIRDLLDGNIKLEIDEHIVIFLNGEQFIKESEEGWKKVVGDDRFPVSLQTIRDAVETAVVINRQMKHKFDSLYPKPF